jgi:lipid A 3-O-deacylase
MESGHYRRGRLRGFAHNGIEPAFLLIKSYFPMWKLRAGRVPDAAEIEDEHLIST